MNSELIIEPSEYQGNQEDIEMFVCPVCIASIVIEPVECLKCENVICLNCSLKSNSCPSCRNFPFKTKKLTLVARQALDKKNFKCRSCDEIFTYQERLKHKCAKFDNVSHLKETKQKIREFQ